MNIDYAKETCTLPIGHLDALLLIPVRSGQSTIPLVFDSGASITLISRSAAEKLNAVRHTETVKGAGNAGMQFTADTVIIPHLSIGTHTVSELKVVVVEDETLDFGTDDNGTHFIISGLLGWDVLEHFTWRYDSEKSALAVSEPTAGRKYIEMADWDNMPILHAKLNGKKVLFGFDSGNTNTVLGDRYYQTLSNDTEYTETTVGVDGTREEIVRKETDFQIEIGRSRVKLQNIPAVNRRIFPSKYENIYGLLAADIICGKSWTFDYLNRHFVIF